MMRLTFSQSEELLDPGRGDPQAIVDVLHHLKRLSKATVYMILYVRKAPGALIVMRCVEKDHLAWNRISF